MTDAEDPPRLATHHLVFRGIASGSVGGLTFFSVVTLLLLIDYKIEDALDELVGSACGVVLAAALFGVTVELSRRLRHVAARALALAAAASLVVPIHDYAWNWSVAMFFHSRRVAWHWFTQLTSENAAAPEYLGVAALVVMPFLVVVGLTRAYRFPLWAQSAGAFAAGLGTFVACIGIMGRVNNQAFPFLLVGPVVLPVGMLAGEAAYNRMWVPPELRREPS